MYINIRSTRIRDKHPNTRKYLQRETSQIQNIYVCMYIIYINSFHHIKYQSLGPPYTQS